MWWKNLGNVMKRTWEMSWKNLGNVMKRTWEMSEGKVLTCLSTLSLSHCFSLRSTNCLVSISLFPPLLSLSSLPLSFLSYIPLLSLVSLSFLALWISLRSTDWLPSYYFLSLSLKILLHSIIALIYFSLPCHFIGAKQHHLPCVSRCGKVLLPPYHKQKTVEHLQLT